jgi:hypothetical protein
MKGALGWGMIGTALCCAAGLTALIAEMSGAVEFMTPVWLDMVEQGASREPIRFRIVNYFGLVGLLGACGYFASWLWLPAAAWRIVQAKRRGSALRTVDRVLPTVVALQILAVQYLLRLTVIRHFSPPLI